MKSHLICVSWNGKKRTSRVSSLTGRAEFSVLGLHMRTAKKEVTCDDWSVESLWNMLISHEIEQGLEKQALEQPGGHEHVREERTTDLSQGTQEQAIRK